MITHAGSTLLTFCGYPRVAYALCDQKGVVFYPPCFKESWLSGNSADAKRAGCRVYSRGLVEFQTIQVTRILHEHVARVAPDVTRKLLNYMFLGC